MGQPNTLQGHEDPPKYFLIDSVHFRQYEAGNVYSTVPELQDSLELAQNPLYFTPTENLICEEFMDESLSFVEPFIR